MEAQELSATAFAEKLEVGRATISHLMSGRNKPSLDFVMKVVSTFSEVDINQLLYGKKKPPTLRASRAETLEDFNTKKTSSTTAEKLGSSHFRKSEKQANQKVIERIVIFYKDGTFTHHNPDEAPL